MLLSTTEILFFTLVFVTIFSSAKGAISLGPKIKLTSTISLLITSAIAALFLVAVYKLAKVSSQGENFHFELTPEKRCQGGPYMRSSDPELQKFCDQFTPQQMAQFQCGQSVDTPGQAYVGLPVHWKHANMSNDMWENTEMLEPNTYYPSVL